MICKTRIFSLYSKHKYITIFGAEKREEESERQREMKAKEGIGERASEKKREGKNRFPFTILSDKVIHVSYSPFTLRNKRDYLIIK